jgi:hypothetical protein
MDRADSEQAGVEDGRAPSDGVRRVDSRPPGWKCGVFTLASGLALSVAGAAVGAAWLFFIGCFVIGAFPLIAIARSARRYRPRRVYDRSLLADLLGTSSTPHVPRARGTKTTAADEQD